MPNEISATPAIAWLCAAQDWKNHGPFDGETRVIGMEDPDENDVSVLFIGRDSNAAKNWTYGIPVDKLAGVDYVVLFELRHNFGLLVLPGDFLRELHQQSGTYHQDGRWRVSIDWIPNDVCYISSLAPIGASHLKTEVGQFLLDGPRPSLWDWYINQRVAT